MHGATVKISSATSLGMAIEILTQTISFPYAYLFREVIAAKNETLFSLTAMLG